MIGVASDMEKPTSDETGISATDRPAADSGLASAAAKMAAKARPVLERHRARLAAYTDVTALFRILDSEG